MKKLNLKKTERFTVATTPLLLNTIKKVAEKNERSVNWQVERILKDWLIEKGYLKKEDV